MHLDFLEALTLKEERLTSKEISLLGAGLGREEGIVEEVGYCSEAGMCSGVILFNFGLAADIFLRLAAERVGSARVQFSKTEKTLELSKVGAGILSRISKATSGGRAERGLSTGRELVEPVELFICGGF